MLVELAVRNLGVIADLRLSFGAGMSAVTGETGAGKTMIVEAIGLLLGARPDSARVRPQSVEAVIEGLFVDESDDEIVLRRVVPRKGRSRCYVNGQLVPASQLASIAPALVELHGQHAQQSLLRPRSQRDALDRYASIDLGPLAEATQRVRAAESALEEMGGDARARARELDLLRYQLDELSAAGLDDPAEDTTLEQFEDELADAVAHREAAGRAVENLTGDGGALDMAAKVAHLLEGRIPFKAQTARLLDATAELHDIASDLRSVGERIDEDPRRLAEVRARRQLLVELRRKYGESLHDVIAYRDEIADRIEALASHEARAATLEAELASALAERDVQARRVGAQRREAAPALANDIEQRLTEVSLPGARIEVDVNDDGDGSGEKVDLLLSANAGLDPQPLAKVASGGELSRTMLALHLVLSAGPPTMVFDEVDAGIGGATATSVGRALAGLAKDHQVLIVTHLPQVAAFADEQLVVEKSHGGTMTSSSIRHLDASARVIELARMMSGSPDSDSARDHAEELLVAAAQERDG